MMEVREPSSILESQLQSFFVHMHDRIMNGTSRHDKTEKDRQAEAALEYAYEVLVRNNEMCDLVQGQEYKTIKDGEKKLKGKTEIGKIFCIDGRIPRIFESFAINTWEKAAGLIRAQRRESDGKLIPSSSSLAESLAAKIDPADPEKDLLEINAAHYDSTNPEHGCAAINLIKRALTRNAKELDAATGDDKIMIEEDLVKKAELEEILTPEEIKSILDAPTPEEANLIILEKVNVEAITNYYNDMRVQKGLPPLKRVGISALYDTATMGLELRQNGDTLSTTAITNKHMDELQNWGTSSGNAFGSCIEVLNNSDIFIDFSHKLLDLETEIIENSEGKYNGINDEIDSYIGKHLDDLTDGQKKALKFKISRKVAFQYLTGLSKIPESGHPQHPFARHNEAYIAISVQGQFVGKYDLVEQEFGASPADIDTAVHETLVANLVMDVNKLKPGSTRVGFICSSVSRSDWEDNTETLKRARATNADLIRGIARNDKLKALMKEGKFIPIPVLLDENRKVIEIPDHSAYF